MDPTDTAAAASAHQRRGRRARISGAMGGIFKSNPNTTGGGNQQPPPNRGRRGSLAGMFKSKPVADPEGSIWGINPLNALDGAASQPPRSRRASVAGGEVLPRRGSIVGLFTSTKAGGPGGQKGTGRRGSFTPSSEQMALALAAADTTNVDSGSRSPRSPKKGVEKGELRLRILGKQWQKRYCLLVSYIDPALDATHACLAHL